MPFKVILFMTYHEAKDVPDRLCVFSSKAPIKGMDEVTIRNKVTKSNMTDSPEKEAEEPRPADPAPQGPLWIIETIIPFLGIASGGPGWNEWHVMVISILSFPAYALADLLSPIPLGGLIEFVLGSYGLYWLLGLGIYALIYGFPRRSRPAR